MVVFGISSNMFAFTVLLPTVLPIVLLMAAFMPYPVL